MLINVGNWQLITISWVVKKCYKHRKVFWLEIAWNDQNTLF